VRADDYVLSFEVGVVKPNHEIFEIALNRLGVDAADTVMVGDSEEADGAARARLRFRPGRPTADVGAPTDCCAACASTDWTSEPTDGGYLVAGE
jgi:histidinol phosphatase-like enzyme